MPVEQRRQQLLDAALALIGRDGYAGLTIEAIAAEAGVTKPVVYGVYANLADLLTALIDHTQAEALTQILAAFPADPGRLNSPQIIADIARGWAQAVRENPRIWAPVLLAGPQTPTEVLERIEQGRQAIRGAMARFMGGGHEIGVKTAERHRWIAHMVLASAEHFGRMILTDPGVISDDEIATLFQDMITGLLFPPS
ncbi:TetR/AcrR family transcriptional regulator [Amycolatopsis cynarae]|uniref:TetR/AcrR family transcriptional regulator n=1 Tax=Amycolatopsis cynarae TaxID=2995223 RepID=A0ABY7B8P4_9PSEU|nr:TetR/AcrR family transcriptional regulator [Amycolatopsis sp. HUAS 11-8]WAL68719.1 TetR/AcrR family transcriptional regulator [Amycolatopsis sp. HUAS 11-8]